jgi:hypothetical protein
MLIHPIIKTQISLKIVLNTTFAIPDKKNPRVLKTFNNPLKILYYLTKNLLQNSSILERILSKEKLDILMFLLFIVAIH